MQTDQTLEWAHHETLPPSSVMGLFPIHPATSPAFQCTQFPPCIWHHIPSYLELSPCPQPSFVCFLGCERNWAAALAVLPMAQLGQPRQSRILTEQLEFCRLRAAWLIDGPSWTCYFSAVILSSHCIALHTFCGTSLLSVEPSALPPSFFLRLLQLLYFLLEVVTWCGLLS